MRIRRLIKGLNRRIELNRVKRTIFETRNLHQAKNLMQEECDSVFPRRLKTNPEALRLSFWENHFEWKAVLEYREIKGRVLDFSCGSGHSDIFLARRGMTVHGIDLSPVGIALANLMRKMENTDVRCRLSFSVSDVTEDGPDGKPYDSAWSSHVFEHIANPAPILEGLKRWRKPGAPLLISVPLGNAYDDPGHVNHFRTTDELLSFLGPSIRSHRIELSSEFRVIRTLCHFTD